MTTKRKRAKKQVVPKGGIGYAHPRCMQRASKNRVANRQPRYEVVVTLPPMKFYL